MKKILVIMPAVFGLAGIQTSLAQNYAAENSASIIEAMIGGDPSEVEVPYDAPYGDNAIVAVSPTSVRASGITARDSKIPTFSVLDHDLATTSTAELPNYFYNYWTPQAWKEAFCYTIELASNRGFDHLPYNLILCSDEVNQGTAAQEYADGDRFIRYHLKFDTPSSAFINKDARISLPCIYHPSFLANVIKNTTASATHDNIYENKNSRQHLLATMFEPVAIDFSGDGHDDILVFYNDRVLPYNCRQGYIPSSDQEGVVLSSIPNSLDCIDGSWNFQPNTWTAVKYDFDGNGRPDVMAFCISANHTNVNTNRTWYAVYLPDGDWQRASVKKISTLMPDIKGHFSVPKADIIYPHGKTGAAYVALGREDYESGDGCNRHYTRVAMLPVADLKAAFASEDFTVPIVTKSDIAYEHTESSTVALGLSAPLIAAGYPMGLSDPGLLMAGKRFYTFDEDMKPVQRYELYCGAEYPMEVLTANMRMYKNTEGEDAMLNSSTFAMSCIERNSAGFTDADKGTNLKFVDFSRDGNYTAEISKLQGAGRDAVLNLSTVTPQGVQLQFTQKFFTASDPIIKYAMAIPPFDASIIRESAPKGTVQCEMSQTSGESTAFTTTRTASAGMTAGVNLAGALKLGADMEEGTTFSESSTKSYSFTSGRGYSATQNKDVVVFSYIPTYVFEYQVIGAPAGKEDLLGQKVRFMQGRNFLDNSLPEAMWTVDSYNKYAEGTNLMRFGHDLFPHTEGSLGNYRRTSVSSSLEYIKSLFPVKENGFFAMSQILTTGDGGSTTSSLSISEGESTGSGESITMKNGINFSLGIDLKEFNIPLTMEFSRKQSWANGVSWTRTESWNNTIKTSGTVPYAPNDQSYSYRQIWYEYEDAEKGQNFLVSDWVLVDYTRVPVSLNLEMIDLYYGMDYEGVLTCMPYLNWSSMSNTPIDRCVLEYKVDGITPERNYDDASAGVTLNQTLIDWTEVTRTWAGTEWIDTDFTPTAGSTNCTWEFFDLLSLTYEQINQLRAIVGYANDIQIYYRVRAEYGGAASAESPRRAAGSLHSVYSNEVSAPLIRADFPTGVQQPEEDYSDYPVEIYTLQGIRMPNVQRLPAGLYIRRQGNHATKILVR